MGNPFSHIEKPIKKILFIDDNDIDLVMAKKMIAASKIKTDLTTQSSIESALKYLSGLKSAEKPDIIFLDLYLPPNESGWYFLSVLELQPKLISITCQINILSSSLNTQDLLKSKKYKTVANYFIKPFTVNVINEVLREDKER